MSITPRQALDAQMFAGTGSFGQFMAQSPTIAPGNSAIEIQPWGFPMLVEYEHDAGEPAYMTAQDGGHPGSAAYVCVIAAYVGGVNITDMLSSQQHKTLELDILGKLQ